MRITNHINKSKMKIKELIEGYHTMMAMMNHILFLKE